MVNKIKTYVFLRLCRSPFTENPCKLVAFFFFCKPFETKSQVPLSKTVHTKMEKIQREDILFALRYGIV